MFDDNCTLNRVVFIIKSKCTGYTLQIFDFCHSFSNFSRISRFSIFNTLYDCHSGIMSQSSKNVGFHVEHFLIFSNEVFVQIGSIVRRIQVAEESTVEGFFASDFRKFSTIPTVATCDSNIQADFTSLFNNQTNFLVVTGNIDEVRVSCFDFGKSRFKVSIFLQICFFSNYFATIFQEVFFEELCQAFGIVTGVINHNSSTFQSHFFSSEVSHYSTLERVDEASAEVIISSFTALRINGYVRVSTHRSNCQYFASIVDSARSNTCRRQVRTDNSNNLILRN